MNEALARPLCSDDQPSRDRARLLGEVKELLEARRSGERSSATCLQRAAYGIMRLTIAVGRFRPFGHQHDDFDAGETFDDFTETEFAALSALYSNTSVYAVWRAQYEEDGVTAPAWYARRARELAAELEQQL